MTRTRSSPRLLLILGFGAMLVGAFDPLEGSPVIVLGAGLAALSAARDHGPHRALLLWALGLVAIGTGALFTLSALGGIGGTSGWSAWWALLLLPYPVGWILGLVGAVRTLRAPRRRILEDGNVDR